jgi:hypothetical protein
VSLALHPNPVGVIDVQVDAERGGILARLATEYREPPEPIVFLLSDDPGNTDAIRP